MAAEEPPSRLGVRCLAASGASLVSALVVNPFDVIKTRMQAQAASGHLRRSSLFELSNITSCPAPCLQQTSCSPACATYNSMWDAFRKITRQEGYRALWLGTRQSLMMSVPMVGIYMPLYDQLKASWASSLGAAAPLAAGALSRTIAVVCVAPFELLRTRLQAHQARAYLHATPLPPPTLRLLATGGGAFLTAESSLAAGSAARLRQLARLWTGASATIARDVPFSAIYWSLVEPVRHQLLAAGSSDPGAGGAAAGATASAAAGSSGAEAGDAASGTGSAAFARIHTRVNGNRAVAMEGIGMAGPGPASAAAAQLQAHHAPHHLHHHPHYSKEQVLFANAVAGSVAGAAAAALTTPFDVVKTRRQIAAADKAPPGTIWETLVGVYRAQGARGLFTGVAPRAARAAPACGIVISCYELLKTSLEEWQENYS